MLVNTAIRYKEWVRMAVPEGSCERASMNTILTWKLMTRKCFNERDGTQRAESGLTPVIDPFNTSAPRPKKLPTAIAYVAVLAVTLMTPILGSSGPPSCLPSSRSPSHAFNAGE